MIIVPTKIVQSFVNCGVKTEEMHPGGATDKYPGPRNKMSLVRQEVVGRSPDIPGTEMMPVRLELGQKWQWVGDCGGRRAVLPVRGAVRTTSCRASEGKTRFYSTCN